MTLTVTDAVVLDPPFRGDWVARNSPARRIPSHGTSAFGSSHAIDFVAVDARGRSAPITWRTLVATEAPERFSGFGAPILAPASGTVVIAHDGEADHVARRSLPAGVPYLLAQGGRARLGTAGLAGNHVGIEIAPGGPIVLVAHLRRGSVEVAPGARVTAGQQIGRCGNSGNSTEPHVHLQVSSTVGGRPARGIPFLLRRADGTTWLPEESEIVSVSDV